MGQQGLSTGLGIVGMVAGGVIGGPVGAAVGGMVGSMAGGIIGSFLFKKKPLITDTQLGNSSYGNPIPLLYGTARLPGVMIWQTKVKTTSSSMGKGGGGSTAYHYHQSAAFAFCEGPANLRKIWLDGKLFWNAADPKKENTKHTFNHRAHDGGEDELPDPLIEQWVMDNVVGAPNSCPAYRGLCYLVCEGVDLINYGNRFPQVTAEWTSTGHRDVLVVPLIPWTTDITPYAAPWVGYNLGMTVDWTSATVYAKPGSDGTIRSYSIASAGQTASITSTDYGPGPTSIYYPTTVPLEFPNFNGIATCDGARFLYVYGYMLPLSASYFLQALDKNTLKPVAAPTVMTDEPYWLVSPVPGQVSELTVRTITAPDGTRDFLIGAGGYSNLFVCTVLLGGDIEPPIWAPMHFENLSRWTSIIAGDWDLLADGTHRVYVIHGSFWGDGIYVYSFQTDGTYIAQLTLLGILMPATFGLTNNAPGSNNYWFGSGWYAAADGSLTLRIGGTTNTTPGGGDFVVKIDPNKLAAGENPVIWQNNIPGATFGAFYQQMEVRNSSQGEVAFPVGGSGGWSNVVTPSGQYSNIPDTTAIPLGVEGYAYNADQQGMLQQAYVGGQWVPAVIYLNHVTAPNVSVADIIADLCGRVGLTGTMIDVSLVTDTCNGYVVRDLRSAGAAIADLLHTFLLDMVESDYVLHFVPRGRAAVATLSYTDLVPPNQGEPGRYWQAKAAQEQEMPLEFVVKFMDPALDYQPGSAYARRPALPVPTMFAKRRQVVDLPVIVDNLTARHLAERWLYTMWAERVTYHSGLSAAWLWLDPGDNITVTLPDQTLTVRIEQMQIGADLAMQLTMASEDISTYVASSSPGPLTGAVAQTIAPSVSATLLNFNVPLLRDGDSTAGTTGRVYFAAAAANVAGFTAAAVYRSTDNINYPIEGTLSAAANWGRAMTVLADTPAPFATDYLNTVRIMLNPGSAAPTSCSYADLMEITNALLIGAEVIQFQTVTDETDGSFTLSVLKRGCRGTDWATATHTINETVILLEVATTGAGTVDLSDINRSEYWKLVGPSTSVALATTQTWTYLGYDLMPYSPVGVTGVYVGSDIVLQWTRRTRIGGLLADGTDTVPLGETVEAYEVDVLHSGVVARTLFPLFTPTATYSAAQITADWGSPPSTLQVRVYQMSSVVGRGFSRLWTLDLSGTSASSSAGGGTSGGTTTGGSGGAGTPTLPGLMTSLRSTTQTIGTISLAWVLPTDGGALDAVIVGYRLHGSSGAYTLLTLAASATVATVSSLTAATAYDFEVYGRNAAGGGTPALLSNISTQATTVILPGVITSLHSTAQTSSAITLAWTLPGSGGPVTAVVVGYRLHSSTGAYTLVTLSASTTSTTVSGLTASTAYDFEAYTSNSAGGSTPALLANVSTSAASTGGGVANGIYVLDSVVPSAIAAAPVGYKVVEATSDGVGAFWSSTDVTAMKAGGGLVLGYFDAGWCEDYRPYYATASAAGILGTHPDPSWPAEYSVAFWSATWQSIAFSWCDSLMAAGFDGIYLDVVDAWGDAWAQANVPGGGATNSANAMIALVAAIRTHAHATNPSFQVWVNGGEELFGFSAPSWLNALDGMYKEQVCYNPTSASGPTSSADRTAEFTLLANCTGAGKPVVLIEYVTGAGPIANVRAVCTAEGYGYYIANTDLNLSGVDTEGF